jgi:nucleoside-diphosphate-sugar epimerase
MTKKDKGRVLVTGANGYIGSVLAPLLDRNGYAVTGLDTGYYDSARLFHDRRDRPRVICRDVREVTPADLEGFDAIVHLAELSNDPLCEFDEAATIAINHGGSVALAKAAREAGVKRFIYASSCSVYGAAGNSIKTEDSAPDPQTAYARCKVMVERDVRPMASSSFCPVFLRNATAFGASPSMRFDIVLNNLAGLAWTTGRISMTSDGSPWRPLVHVEDISGAVLASLNAPAEAVCGEIFNVGSDPQNYRVRDIAEAVAGVFPRCSLEFGENGGDNRSYRVSFDKITNRLPGFACRWDARSGALELRRVFERIGMTPEIFQAAAFTRLKRLRELMTSGQVDETFRWTQPAKTERELAVA